MSQEEKFYYLTRKGVEKLKREHRTLKEIRLSKIKESLFRSFNPEDLDPEYFTFRNDLDFLESRINELENILRSTKIIKIPPKSKRNIVYLGATVLVETGGRENEFEIVETLEANPSLGKISNESPVGKALLGRKIGDMIKIQLGEKKLYKIRRIKYKEQT